MNFLDEKLEDVEKIIADPNQRISLYDEIEKSSGKYEWARIVMLIGAKRAKEDGKKVSFTDIHSKYGMDRFYGVGAFQKAIGTALTGKGGNESSSCTLADIDEELKKFESVPGTPQIYKWEWTLKELINYIYNYEAKAVNSKPNLDTLKNIGGTYKVVSGGSLVKMSIQDPCNLLMTNMQLIMNGAPGTGKTYSARNEIADKLFGIQGRPEKEKEGIKKIRMGMVQFHPSYDYTDFIEGIRPTMSAAAGNGGSIGYTLKNGTFKRFCRRAGVIERILAAGKTPDQTTIREFLQGEDQEILDFWKDWLETNKDKESPALPSFLFIIDEINRAEISKVLGEIMYCLDADYRGAKGMIATQYSALATEESFFTDKTNDKFFIPSNVYIIGTMNDIDRSVEVFDFALRRRFAWYEVKAEEVMDKVLRAMHVDTILQAQYPDYLSRIEKLNSSIGDKLKLNRHYYLGPSYFAKIALYFSGGSYEEARKEVWSNHLSQILCEYVKGKRAEAEIGTIEADFIG